jgi:uncharacterized protein (DUF427 family)
LYCPGFTKPGSSGFFNKTVRQKEEKMSEDTVTIKNRFTGEVLASAKKTNGVSLFEGAWYFEPDRVDMTHLVVTERTYTCSYKGVCYWIDLNAPEHQVEDVAFVYFKTNPGYEFVRDRIGFYAGKRGATMED